jgi:hypothetical protein
MKDGCILGFMPLHDMVELRQLEGHWLTFFDFPWNQPVDEIKVGVCCCGGDDGGVLCCAWVVWVVLCARSCEGGDCVGQLLHSQRAFPFQLCCPLVCMDVYVCARVLCVIVTPPHLPAPVGTHGMVVVFCLVIVIYGSKVCGNGWRVV